MSERFVQFNDLIHKPDDQCDGPGSRGESQCQYISCAALARMGTDTRTPDSTNCPKHAGRPEKADTKQRKLLHSLQINTSFSTEIDRHTAHEAAISLHAEVAVIRILLETTLNRCRSTTELEANAGRILELTKSLESLVKSCAALEKARGETLSQGQAQNLINSIAEVVMEHIHDPLVIEKIQLGIVEALECH